MNSFQESKNELEAAIRYAENAISSAQATIESMEFRQEMAKKNYQEQTGREEALTKQVQELEERNDELNIQIVEQTNREATLERKVQELESKVQGQYDDIVMLQREVEVYTKKYNELVKQKEASSGPCGCQAYRDLEERATMPVIPKDVAIAIFREGTLFGVEAACDEIQGETINISESDYVGDFSISFERDIDLDDHIDFDWVRGKIGDYDEGNVVANLEGLCAKNNFECRIHGIDGNDQSSERKA